MTKKPKVDESVIRTPFGSRIRLVLVTPEIAQKWLENARANRPLAEGTVRNYIYSLSEGKWGLCTVMLDQEGRMADGQHHLQAIKRTQISCVMIVHEKCSEQELAHVDMNRPRSTADWLAIKNKDAFARNKTSMARIAVTLSLSNLVRVPPELTESFITALGAEHVNAICNRKFKLPAPWMFALVYARPIMGEKFTDELLQKILTKDSLYTRGAHHAERSVTMAALLRLLDRPKEINGIRTAHMVLKAMQSLHEGTPMRQVREDSSGLAWIDAERKAKELLTVKDMLPSTYPLRREDPVDIPVAAE